MTDFKLLNYTGKNGEARPGILVAGDIVLDLQEALPGKAWGASTLAVLGAWDEALPALSALAGAPKGAARRLADRPNLRATMGLVMGDLVPASRGLDPRFLVRLLAP